MICPHCKDTADLEDDPPQDLEDNFICPWCGGIIDETAPGLSDTEKIIIQAVIAGWRHRGLHPTIKEHWFTKKERVLFADRVLYKKEEVEKITAAGGLTVNIHELKKRFKGDVQG